MKNCTSERCRGIGTATRTRSVGSIPAARRGSSGDISILLALVVGHGKGRRNGPTPVAERYGSPQAPEERYVNCGTSVGDREIPTPLNRAMSREVFRLEATSAPGSAEFQRVRPFLGIIPMFEPEEPAFLSARQEHRQADVIRVGPQFIACAGLHQQQGHREVARSLQRLTPLLLPFRAEAHVARDGVEENLLARSLPRPAEEAPTLPVLRRLDDPTLMTVLVHRPH